MTFRAHVRNGRLLLDAPTDLPDGAEVELELVDEMTDAEREELEQALAEGQADVQAGRVHSAADVLNELRRR